MLQFTGSQNKQLYETNIDFSTNKHYDTVFIQYQKVHLLLYLPAIVQGAKEIRKEETKLQKSKITVKVCLFSKCC